MNVHWELCWDKLDYGGLPHCSQLMGKVDVLLPGSYSLRFPTGAW